MVGRDIGAYDIGVADIRLFSLFSAADAERIVAATGKKPRHGFRKTAKTLNWAITLAVAQTSAALAAPASKQGARAKRLQATLGQALLLMGFDTELPPAAAENFASAYAVLLPAGENDPLVAICAKLGFSSPQDAIRQGLAALLLFQICAEAAHGHWKARPEKTKHKPDRFVMAWATTMVGIYKKVVKAEAPKYPTSDSPLIRFCEAMRVHVMECASSSENPAIQAFRATLKRVRPASMAAFINRHLSRTPQRISRRRRPK